MQKLPISIVINTYNAELHLRRVLDSLGRYEEILICDMHSNDKTIEIAQEYGCSITYFDKYPCAEPARDFANHQARNEWVLVVDADEIVPEALTNYLADLISSEQPPYGLWIPRKNYFMGKFMHASYPDHILRFFRRDASYWPPHVHSLPQIDGAVVYIPAKRKDLAFIHLANDSISQVLEKLNRYTQSELSRSKRNKQAGRAKLFFSPAFRFFKSYILKGGFRDGKEGFIHAGLDALYKFITLSKQIERQSQEQQKRNDTTTN